MRRGASYFCSTHRCPRQWKNVLARRCPRCLGDNTRLKPVRREVAGTILAQPDIEPHYNITIGRVVKSRRHLRDLQKRHGFMDYQGIKGSGQSKVFGPGGELRQLRSSERTRS